MILFICEETYWYMHFCILESYNHIKRVSHENINHANIVLNTCFV